MSAQRKQLVLITVLATALASATAQVPAIDPVLLAKANAGNAAAQVLVGRAMLQAWARR